MSLELQVALAALFIALPLTGALRLKTRPNRRPGFELVPRIGGFSILTAFLAAPAVVALFSTDARRFVRDDWSATLALGTCGSLVFLMGARDDFRPVNWRVKFGVQFLASAALFAGGFHVGEMTLPGGDTVALGWLDLPVTVLWLVVVTNAMNLIDGQDGVAAGISVLVSATMAYVAWDLGHDLIAMLFAALAGASLGFVPFNLPHARRLLGDSGAYFLGFTIGALSIAGFVDTTGRVPLYIPLVALGLPVLDAGIAFLRRYLAGTHPFEADHDHFHDRIERIFHFSSLKVAITSYAITVVFCAAALLLHAWYKNVGSAIVGGAVVVFALLLVLALGYVGTMWNSPRMLILRGRPEPVGADAGG
ncbi:MAG: MraY family glycosyltransferase [Anaerolineaceae bacterium]